MQKHEQFSALSAYSKYKLHHLQTTHTLVKNRLVFAHTDKRKCQTNTTSKLPPNLAVVIRSWLPYYVKFGKASAALHVWSFSLSSRCCEIFPAHSFVCGWGLRVP